MHDDVLLRESELGKAERANVADEAEEGKFDVVLVEVMQVDCCAGGERAGASEVGEAACEERAFNPRRRHAPDEEDERVESSVENARKKRVEMKGQCTHRRRERRR